MRGELQFTYICSQELRLWPDVRSLNNVGNLDASCVLNNVVVGLCLRDGRIGPVNLTFGHALGVALLVESSDVWFASLGQSGSTLNFTAGQAFLGMSQGQPREKASGGDKSGELHDWRR